MKHERVKRLAESQELIITNLVEHMNEGTYQDMEQVFQERG